MFGLWIRFFLANHGVRVVEVWRKRFEGEDRVRVFDCVAELCGLGVLGTGKIGVG